MSQITPIRRRIASCFLAAWLLSLLCLLIQGRLVMAASSSEEALRARVEQCYNALQRGDWQKAEKYFTKDSKSLFRSQTNGLKPLMAYQIKSIKIEPDGRTASVVVQVPMVSTVVPHPILVPKASLWRLINRVWYMDLPRPDPNATAALISMAPKVMKPGPALVFSTDLKFESTWCGLGKIEGNEAKVARFPFTNVSTHVVTLSEIQLGCACLRLKTQQKEYKPGESGTLEIEFDPSGLGVNSQTSFMQDIIIKTEPGGAYAKLVVGALLAPAPAPAAKP